MIVKYPSEIVNKNPIKCFFFTRVVLGMVFTHSNTTVTREGHVYPFMFAPIVRILLILLVVMPFSIALSCTSNKGHKLSLPRWSHSSSWQENINYHLTLRPPLWITSAPSPSKRDFYPDTARNSSPRKNNPIPNFYEGSPIKFSALKFLWPNFISIHSWYMLRFTLWNLVMDIQFAWSLQEHPTPV